MNTYFIIGVVVVCMAAFANTEDPETAPTSREARLFGGGGWGWKKRRPIETVFITYPKKGWGWSPPKHGIHHYHTSGGHGGGGGGGGGWGWQPKVHVIPKHIHLPGGHFEEPGWGWDGWGHEQGSYGSGGGWGWGGGGGGHGKKGHKKGGHGGGHGGGGHGGWGWADPWQGGYERSDVSSELIEPGRHLELVEDSSEIEPLQPYADDAPFAYVPNYDQPEY